MEKSVVVFFFFLLSNEKADGVNRSTTAYHWRLNEWLPFSGLCRSPTKVKWVYPADPVPLFNHKHDLLCFLLWTEWTTQGVKVEDESKRKPKMLKDLLETRQQHEPQCCPGHCLTKTSMLGFWWKSRTNGDYNIWGNRAFQLTYIPDRDQMIIPAYMFSYWIFGFCIHTMKLC